MSEGAEAPPQAGISRFPRKLYVTAGSLFSLLGNPVTLYMNLAILPSVALSKMPKGHAEGRRLAF